MKVKRIFLLKNKGLLPFFYYIYRINKSNMKFKKIIMAIISVLVAGMGFISCSRGYRPEIVNNPLEEEVYYIIGQIKEENSPVEG